MQVHIKCLKALCLKLLKEGQDCDGHILQQQVPHSFQDSKTIYAPHFSQ